MMLLENVGALLSQQEECRRLWMFILKAPGLPLFWNAVVLDVWECRSVPGRQKETFGHLLDNYLLAKCGPSSPFLNTHLVIV